MFRRFFGRQTPLRQGLFASSRYSLENLNNKTGATSRRPGVLRVEPLEKRELLSATPLEGVVPQVPMGLSGDIPPMLPMDAGPTGESYFIFEDWSSGNSWCDAEKSPSDSDDNLMCWAAAASNILAWGGWGVGEIDTCDEIFAHFQDNWTDSISVPSAGWEWWFQGTDLAAMNGDGGAYFTEYVYDDWMYGGSSGTQTISDIHYLMQAGYGVTLGLSGPGGHAVTCWGLNYNPDTGEYLGLWISDSDDMKGTDTPEDQLRYYEVRTENNRYYLNNYCSSNSWYISYSSGLMARPEIITPVPAGTVVGTLFNDLNGDGDQDPGEEGLADQSVFLDQNGNGTQENRNAVFTNDTPTTLLDVAYVTSTINVDSAITSITDLNLTLDISHTKNRMVSAWLISPDGTRTTLFSNIGGSGDNFENVTFDDEAAETARAVPDGTITGTLQPFYCLSQFDGMNPNGEWTLELYGRWPGYTGTLNSWSLDITESEQLAVTDAEGNFAFTELPDGDYSVIATGPDGWTATGDGSTRDVTLADGQTETVDIGFTDGGESGANHAPVLGLIGNKTVDELTTLTFTASATDTDLPADTLTYSLTGDVPAGASIGASSGVFTWTPTEAQGPDEYTFNVVVSDGEATDFESITVTVNEVNTPPVLATIGNKTVDELTTLTFTASASDVDLPANTLTYSLAGDVPIGATIDASSGVFTWTPTEAQGPGTYTFDVVVSDGEATDSETIIVTVNEVNVAPVLAAIGNKTVDELTTLTFTASATDADLPADTLTYSLAGNVPTGASIGASTGIFTWTPTEAQGPGTYTFNVVVSDGEATDSETISVTVNEVNTPPVLATIGNKTVDELTTLTFTASASDTDLPANTFAYSLSGDVPTGATIEASTGVFTWTPTEAQGSGTYTFDVVVSDGEATDSETITVTVLEVNAAPVLGPIGDKMIGEGIALTFTASATDSDVPVDTLTYSLAGNVPTGASIDGSTGLFTWTPTEAQGPGTYTFDVVVSDGEATDSETISVTVNEVNVAPVLAAIGNKSVNEHATLTFTASATDADLPADTLTYSLAGNVPTGASIDASSGVFTWTPTEDQNSGTYTFNVVVSDGEATDSETITVTVNEVNIAPVLAAIGNKSVNEHATLTFTASATDADLPDDTLTYSLSGNVPTGASIGGFTGVFTWTPTEAQGPGTYTFGRRSLRRRGD